MDKVIRNIKKSKSEVLRIALRSYRGSQFLDIRNFYNSNHGAGFKPTPKGIAVQLNLMPELKEVIEEAIAQAEEWSIGVEDDTE